MGPVCPYLDELLPVPGEVSIPQPQSSRIESLQVRDEACLTQVFARRMLPHLLSVETCPATFRDRSLPMVVSAFQKPCLFLLLSTVLALAACSGQDEEQSPTVASPAESAPEEASLPEAASPYDVLPPAVRTALDKPFT